MTGKLKSALMPREALLSTEKKYTVNEWNLIMPTQKQYDIVKQQVKSFEELGYTTVFEMQSYVNKAAPKIVISNNEKSWRFSEIDWDVVMCQLAELYKRRKNYEKNRKIYNG